MSQTTPSDGEKPEGAPVSQDAATPPQANDAGDGQQTAGAAVTPPLPFYRRPLFWSLLFLCLLLALLGWHIYRQWQAASEQEARQQAELAAVRERNEALDAYLKMLRDLLAQDPCTVKEKLPTLPPPPAGVPGMPLMLPNDPAEPHGSGVDGPQTPLPPSQPPRQEVTPAAKADTMPHLLEQATVLVLAQQSRGLSMGSGFFISQRHIVTNGHVVGDAGQALVTNKATGKVLAARILHRIEEGGHDVAVLELEAPAAITPLSFCFSVQRTERVSAWGFPGAVTGDDPKFKALLEGNAASVPEVVYSDGSVNVVQERDPAIIVHSATVSQGNSGGPLVNQAGQVVGINTFIKLDGESYRQSSIAVVSSAVARLLQQWKIPYLEARPAEAAPQPSGDDRKADAKTDTKGKSTDAAPPAAPAAPKESRTAPAGV